MGQSLGLAIIIVGIISLILLVTEDVETEEECIERNGDREWCQQTAKEDEIFMVVVPSVLIIVGFLTFSYNKAR